MKVIHYIGINSAIRSAGILSVLLFSVLFGLTFLPISFHQDTTEATGSSDPSITMTFTNSTASVDLAVNSTNGTFAESTDATSAKFSVSTSSAGGYTLSISADDDTGNLVNGSETLTSISSAISSSTFDNASYNGKWGYKPSKLNSVANTNFIQSPTTDATTLDVTDSANNEANNYTIALGARADFSKSVGEYTKSLVVEAVSNFTPVVCDNTKLCVQYDGNGLTYEHGELVNNVNYNSTTTQQAMTKYSHTPNIADDGTYSGSTYASSMDVTDTVTIDGASTLNVTIYYDTESTSYDWVSVYQSPFNISNTNDATASNTTGNLSSKLAGRNTNRTTSYTTWYTQSYTVTGDTVKFHFRSDSGGNYYGYYAIVTGTSVINTRTVYSGEYATPTGANAIFRGWSSTQTAAGTGLPSQVEYTNESEVMSNIPGNEGETKTLYAVWQQGQNITFNMDSNVSSIAILNSDDTTAGTITTSGQTLVLAQGNTYTIKPTHTTGYTTDTITKTTGAGTINGKQFTVGSGSATINITSKQMLPMQNYSCSNLANIGDTDMVYDTRDGEAYLIGKLADNKCWLLDNLRLDLENSTVLANTTADNTNASATSLNYMKNGGGTTSDQYPTAKINNEAWTSSSQNYYSIPMTISTYKDQTTTSYGSGSGKIGVYYNFCAASAGSYCYGNGTSAGTSSGDAAEDICPAGWRMPTGGSSEEYQALYTAYSSNATNFRNSLSTPLPGLFYFGSAHYQGSNGYFWSSTRSSDSNMYGLLVNSSNVYPQDDDNRFYGLSVRCLLMPPTTYTLNYDKNTTDAVSNMPSSQTAAIQDDRSHSFPLSTSAVPSRPGYTFAGWGTSSDQGIPTYKYENGSFTPSEASVYANDNPETLYAIWQVPRQITFDIDSNVSTVQILDPNGNVVSTITSTGTKVSLIEPLTYTIKPTHTTGYVTNVITKTSGAGTLNGKEFTVGAGAATISVTSKVMQPMQNWTGCSNLGIGDTEQVYDTRDNEVYLVGKLADNKCWMLDNLRLDLGNSTVLANTTASNTNASATSLNYMKNGGGTTSDKYPTAKINNVAWTSFSQDYYSIPMTISTYKDQTTTSYGSGSGKIGVYYNFCAASAGSYCYGDGTSYGTSSGDAGEDICPAGWRMPTGGSSGESQALYTAYSSNATNFRNALSTPLSGYFYGGLARDQGSYGYFWSSTRYNSYCMYSLSVNSSGVTPQTQSYSGSTSGNSVRCLLR